MEKLGKCIADGRTGLKYELISDYCVISGDGVDEVIIKFMK